MNRTRLLVAALLIAIPVSPLVARGIGDQVDAPARHAVCVGVGDYGSPSLRLESAPKDAAQLHSYLREKQGFQNATLLRDGPQNQSSHSAVTRSLVLSDVSAVVERSHEERLDDVVFFFSGHGISQLTESDRSSYLLLGESWQTDPNRRIAVEEELLPLLRRIKCKRMYILFDVNRTADASPFDSSWDNVEAGIAPPSISRESSEASEGVFVVYASAPGTPSVAVPKDIGVFTRAMLDGMEIYRSYYDLFAYLDRTVPMRSYAYSESDPPRPQYIELGGDFEGLEESGYASSSRLHERLTESEVALQDMKTSIERSRTAGAISTAAFSVGIGMCAGGAASLAVLGALGNYYNDAGLRRARNVSWGVFGASFLLTVPAAVLFFIDF